MRTIPTLEERKEIWATVEKDVDKDTQTYARSVCSVLVQSEPFMRGLLSYLPSAGHATRDEVGRLVYFVMRENTIWGEPCTYRLTLSAAGDLAVAMPVSQMSLLRAFNRETFLGFAPQAQIACKMFKNQRSDYSDVRYDEERREFVFVFK